MCLNPGDILCDRYQIIAQLGEGGFARTYTANDLVKPENSPCVVKEILPPQSTVAEVWQKANAEFEIEAEALRRLGKQHPRIPNLIHHLEDRGNFYLIQEYIPGQSLRDEFTTGTRWTQEQVIVLLEEILSVIEFVHGQGMVHRDIHPGNLIRGSCDGSIVLIDFGAVREISTLGVTNSGEISTTQAIGIRGYMPAEQLLRPWDRYPYNDIYAIGAIALQALTGIHPKNLPPDPEGCELLWHYSTPDRELPQVSDDFRRVLNRMIRFAYCDRYQSAADVLQALRSVTAVQLPPIQQPAMALESDTNIGNSHLPASPTNNQTVPQAENLSEQPYSPLNPRLILPDGLSAGEKILLTSSNPWLKQKGVGEFAASNSKEAFNLFKKSWEKEYGKDPETLVYMNNAFLEASQADYYTIAVALPIDRKNSHSFAYLSTQAKEFLCGVAQAQTEVNLGLLNSNDRDFPGLGFLPSKAINGKGLKVIIADDANDEEETKQRAISLANQPDILAVVGHANSEMTMHAVDIYNKNNLVLMSPGAATEELTHEPRKFFFRTQHTSSLIAINLADYLIEKNQKKAAFLYNQASPFCASFIEEFSKYFQDSQGGEIIWIPDFDISKKDFNAQRAIEEIRANGETAIVLVPDAHVRSSLDSAFEIIKLNGNSPLDGFAARNWIIVGTWTLMGPEILKLVSQPQQNLFKKLIFSVGWHPLSSPNQEFPQQARSLWGGEGNTRIASAYDATRTLIKALEMQPNPSREGMQKMLSSPNFTAYGATGTIQFDSPNNGDRKNPPSDLVHIVECAKEQFGLAFVPVKYPTAEAAGLKCDITDKLEKILNKMVRYDFSDRYQKFEEVLQDLRSLTALKSPARKRRLFSRSNFGFLSLAIPGIIAVLAAPMFLRFMKPQTCPSIQGDALSCGEEILIKTSAPRLKQKAVEEFANSNYRSAFELFKKSWNEEDSIDPETLIYMNNAFLQANNADYYTIAVAVPILKNRDGTVVNVDSAKELLRGVAQAQTQVNLGSPIANNNNNNNNNNKSDRDFPGFGFLNAKAINGKGLRVIIADDANLTTEAVKTANALVKQPDILGVVGHYASEMTVSTVDIYDKNNLVLVSPGSTTEELTEKGRKVFFRTAYSSRFAAETLVNYLRSIGQKQATVLYNPGSSSGSYFTRAFTKHFLNDKISKIVRIREFDLSKKDFNPQTTLNQIQKTGKTAIVLAPDGQITNSLNNAIEIVKANRDRFWIAGIWVVYKPRTLEAATQLKSFEKLVVSVPWHPLTSVNKEFPQKAQKLWRGTVNTDTALAYDAATALIKAMEMQQQPSREGMQKTLSSPNFTAYGATGTIQFDSPNNGDRKNPTSDLVHIVECPKEHFGLAFVPVKYPTAAAAGLKCDRHN